MGSKATLTIQSIVQKETSNIAFTTYQITSANTVAWYAAFDTFKTATDAIILGVIKNVFRKPSTGSGAITLALSLIICNVRIEKSIGSTYNPADRPSMMRSSLKKA